MRGSHLDPPPRRMRDMSHQDVANRPPFEVGNPSHGNDPNAFRPQQRHQLFPARGLRIYQNHG